MRRLLLIPAVLGLLLPTAAQAATWTHDDAASDVWLWGRGPQEAAPGDASADVTRVVVKHGAARVVLSATVTGLHTSGWGLAWSIDTDNAAKRYTVQLSRYDDDRAFRLLYGLNERGQSTPVTCTGAAWTADRGSGTVRVTVPRSCLGGPAWVRAGVLVAAESPVDEMAYYDDGTVDGYTSYIRPSVGPKVRRG